MALFTGTTTQTLAMLLFLHCSQNWSAPEAVAQNSSSEVINLITGTVNNVYEFGTRDAHRGLSWGASISDFFYKNDIYLILFYFELPEQTILINGITPVQKNYMQLFAPFYF